MHCLRHSLFFTRCCKRPGVLGEMSSSLSLRGRILLSGRQYTNQFRRAGQLREKQLRRIIQGLSQEEIQKVHKLIQEIRVPLESDKSVCACQLVRAHVFMSM